LFRSTDIALSLLSTDVPPLKLLNELHLKQVLACIREALERPGTASSSEDIARSSHSGFQAFTAEAVLSLAGSP
jgi:hypothetical protein